jgi:anthranilate phosphoribosyltransferase
VDVQGAIRAVLAGRTLALGEAEGVMRAIADGEATPAQVGALLVLLRQRGETADEIAGFARLLRGRAVPVPAGGGPLLDTCGTGGDGQGTLNVSTLSALVAAAAGVQVAKHGNRSVSGRVGSADLLEALGVQIDLDAERAAACLRRTGFVFLFAPRYHPAWARVGPVRRELGVRTIFNVLGPLLNPAGADRQLLGVADAALVDKLARVLGELGSRRALVVHGGAGEDEISGAGPTAVAELRDGRVTNATWRPEDAGIRPAPLALLRGGDLEHHAALAQRVLAGEAGPLQDAVALNAGAALYVAGEVDAWWQGVRDAQQLLAGRRVRDKLEEVVAFTRGETP